MKNIDYSNIDEIRTGFINYLKTYRKDVARPELRAANALFIARHNIGISLETTMKTDEGIKQAQKMLEDFWIKNNARKNPRGDASVYAHDLRLLKEYLES